MFIIEAVPVMLLASLFLCKKSPFLTHYRHFFRRKGHFFGIWGTKKRAKEKHLSGRKKINRRRFLKRLPLAQQKILLR